MWYHKRPLPLPIGKADSIIRFYYACLRVNSVYTCIPYVTNKPNAADSFKLRTAFFPSYILTFIEIEIDITTGVCVCVNSGFTSLSTIFQSYHDGVWL